MGLALTIRTAHADDLSRLLALYQHLTPNNAPFSIEAAQAIFARFQAYAGSTILLGEQGERLVSSCTVVIVPNLTRGGLPYALIENVVTHTDHRGQGHGTAMLNAATRLAWDHDCYKAMLMTGSKDRATLCFYEAAGFAQSKTGFQKRRI